MRFDAEGRRRAVVLVAHGHHRVGQGSRGRDARAARRRPPVSPRRGPGSSRAPRRRARRLPTWRTDAAVSAARATPAQKDDVLARARHHGRARPRGCSGPSKKISLLFSSTASITSSKSLTEPPERAARERLDGRSDEEGGEEEEERGRAGARRDAARRTRESTPRGTDPDRSRVVTAGVASANEAVDCSEGAASSGVDRRQHPAEESRASPFMQQHAAAPDIGQTDAFPEGRRERERRHRHEQRHERRSVPSEEKGPGTPTHRVSG